MLTDGMLERKAAALDVPARLRETTALHPREAVRALADAVLDVAGPVLADDATLLILGWHNGHDKEKGTPAPAPNRRRPAPHCRTDPTPVRGAARAEVSGLNPSTGVRRCHPASARTRATSTSLVLLS